MSCHCSLGDKRNLKLQSHPPFLPIGKQFNRIKSPKLCLWFADNFYISFVLRQIQSMLCLVEPATEALLAVPLNLEGFGV